MPERQLNESDVRMAGGLPRSDVTTGFLTDRGMITLDAITTSLLTSKGAALESEVIKTGDDPGDLVLIIENRLS